MEQGEDMSSLSGIGNDEVEQEEDGGCSCNGSSCMMHGGCWEEDERSWRCQSRATGAAS